MSDCETDLEEVVNKFTAYVEKYKARVSDEELKEATKQAVEAIEDYVKCRGETPEVDLIHFIHDSPGIVVDPAVAYKECKVYDIGKGKRLAFSKGVIGAIKDEEIAKCEKVTHVESPELTERVRKFREASDICVKEAEKYPKGERLIPRLECMGRELAKRGIKIHSSEKSAGGNPNIKFYEDILVEHRKKIKDIKERIAGLEEDIEAYKKSPEDRYLIPEARERIRELTEALTHHKTMEEQTLETLKKLGSPEKSAGGNPKKMKCPVCGYEIDAKLPLSYMETHMLKEHPEWFK